MRNLDTISDLYLTSNVTKILNHEKEVHMIWKIDQENNKGLFIFSVLTSSFYSISIFLVKSKVCLFSVF